jgi:hypothetical protein
MAASPVGDGALRCGGGHLACRRAAASRPAEKPHKGSDEWRVARDEIEFGGPPNLWTQVRAAGCRPLRQARRLPLPTRRPVRAHRHHQFLKNPHPPIGWPVFMENTGKGRLLAWGARLREAPERRLAAGFGRTITRAERTGTGPPPKLSNAREKPVTDPAAAKGFGGQGRRSASHRRVRLAVSPFNFSTF